MLLFKLRKRQLIIVGILQFCLGFYLVFLLQENWFNVLNKIRLAIKAGDSGQLILAAGATSMLSTIQILPFFLGTVQILIGMPLQPVKWSKIRFCITLMVILLCSWLLAHIYGWRWEFVSSILSAIICLYLLEKIPPGRYNFWQVSFIFIQIIFAFQWLNTVPFLEPFLFGRSDIPLSIKIAGRYLKASSVLNFVGLAFCIPFLISGLATTGVIISSAQAIKAMEESREKERQLRNIQVKALENRVHQELHSLVHDLKTPLVTIQGLNSLLTMLNDPAKITEYSTRIERSVAQMTEMISEILYDSVRKETSVVELLDYVRAQLPLEDQSIFIDIHMSEGLPCLYINKIRVARAIINLMENAILAVSGKQRGNILFSVDPYVGGILVTVSDNGEGISESALEQIWEVGYTTRKTSGLGLPFVKQVIESHGGWVKISSCLGQGTTVRLFLPGINACNVQDQAE